MSKLTLRDYQQKSINDLFLAVIVEQISDQEAKDHMHSLTPEDEDYAKVKEVEQHIDSAISESMKKQNVNPDYASQFSDMLKEAISICFEKTAVIVVLKNDDTYINVNDDEEIDMSTHELRFLEPFSDYYSEGEYRFEELNGRVVLDVDSIEPIDRYEQKIKQKM